MLKMPNSESRTKPRREEEAPTMVIEASLNYEKTHELAEYPLCHRSNPYLDMYMPIREFGYFDVNLYVCNTICGCSHDCGKAHRFSAKHDLLNDAEHLKIYNRTYIKGVW
jgi:hypothetical protein